MANVPTKAHPRHARSFARRRHPTLVGAAVLLAAALEQTAGSAAPPTAAAAPEPTRAPPERTDCLTAHREAQELRQNGKLVEAEKRLLICSSASCPGPVISDCGTWIHELEEATPTIVFEIELNGQPATDAKVFVDGEPIADWSHLVKVDPGSHMVRAALPPFEPHEEKLFMAEGHRMRLVSIQFTSKAASQPPGEEARPEPPAEPPARPTPVVVYPLIAAGVAGLAGFGVFAGLGKAKQNDLEHSCAAQGCTDSALKPMKTDYLIGDVSLGVGVVALVGAAVVYLTRAGERPRAASTVSVDVGPLGGSVKLDRSWGASAAMSW